MYYLAKLAQAAGLTIILIGFLRKFPHLMNPRILLVGIALFLFGWIIDQFLLKK